jgi:FkbM family methyltransferase
VSDNDLNQFTFEGLQLYYPKESYRLHLRETFVLDVYNSSLIKNGDIVLDLGAACGDFCFLASKLTGKNGKVISIEPNVNDFRILEKNISINDIKNIIPINIGVGKEGFEKITFKEETFSFQTKPLENILEDLQIERVDFIKMDIEGYETEVIRNSIRIFENARVVALEYHDTREEVDSQLLERGFKFYPVSVKTMVKNIIKNLIPHPLLSVETVATLIRNNPSLVYKVLVGYDKTKDPSGIYNGLYIKYRDSSLPLH